MEKKRKVSVKELVNMFVAISYFQEQRIIKYGDIYDYIDRNNAYSEVEFADLIHEAIDTPVMIHYAQPTKPWQCRYVYKGDIWYGYIRKNIDKDIYSKYILPYINSHKAEPKVAGKLFIHRVLYKAGILKPLLNLQHKL